MRRALQETYVGGIRTNLHFLDEILADERFVEGGYDTGLLNDWESNHDVPEDLETLMSVVAAAEAAWSASSGAAQNGQQNAPQGSTWKAAGRRESVRGTGA